MLSGYMTTMQKLQQESAQNIENIQSAGIKEMLTYVSAQTEANAKESQAVQQKMTEELQKLAKTQEDIVFLNAKIANTLVFSDGYRQNPTAVKRAAAGGGKMEQSIEREDGGLDQRAESFPGKTA